MATRRAARGRAAGPGGGRYRRRVRRRCRRRWWVTRRTKWRQAADHGADLRPQEPELVRHRRHHRTAGLLSFCVDKDITANVELLPSSKVEEALTRLEKGDVRYRFVQDLSYRLTRREGAVAQVIRREASRRHGGSSVWGSPDRRRNPRPTTSTGIRSPGWPSAAFRLGGVVAGPRCRRSARTRWGRSWRMAAVSTSTSGTWPCRRT